MIRLEAFLETSSFCNLALRPSIALVLKFCFGQGDEFLHLDFLKDLSSRSLKLLVVGTFSLLLGTTVVMARLDLHHHGAFFFENFCKDFCGTNFVAKHLLLGSMDPASSKSKS